MLIKFLHVRDCTPIRILQYKLYNITVSLNIIIIKIYLQKKHNTQATTKNQTNTIGFYTQYLQKKKTHKKKLFLEFLGGSTRRKNTIKTTGARWKSVKKALLKPNITDIPTTRRSNESNKFFNLLINTPIKKTNFNFLKKILFKKYRLKKWSNLDILKNRYKCWLKKKIPNTTFSKIQMKIQDKHKLTHLHRLVEFLFIFNQKKKTLKIFKRLNRIKTYTKIINARPTTPPKTIQSKLFLNNKKKNTFIHYTLQNSTKQTNYIWLYCAVNQPKHNCDDTCIKNHGIVIFTKSIRKIKPTNIVVPKNKLHKQILKFFFYISSTQLHDNGLTPIFNLFYTPNILFKHFTISKHNKILFNNTNIILINNTISHNLNTKNHVIIKSNLLPNNIKTQTTNYYPIFFFNNIKSSNTDLMYNSKKASLYYNNITTKSTAKYKVFFTFFIISFLENFLHKKLWIRVNTQDQINLYYKSYLVYFFKKNEFLYRKFYKLLSVKELLEILWFILQTHDIQIFLAFLRKKFENSHFKKHKKILSILFDVFKKNKIIFKLLGVKGFYFDIRGKIGVSGNAKKRHHSFSIGKITTTSQNTRSYLQQSVVWTPTGQMGITCILQY